MTSTSFTQAATMRCRFVFAGAALIVACAPATQAQARGVGVRILTRLPGFEGEIALDSLATAREAIGAKGADAVAAVRSAYATLQVPNAVTDTIGQVVYDGQFKASFQFAGERLSKYLRCGDGLSGENADHFKVTMAIATYVESLPDGTSRIATGFAAGAQDMSGSSKAPVRCASTGTLETRIATLVKARVAQR